MKLLYSSFTEFFDLDFLSIVTKEDNLPSFPYPCYITSISSQANYKDDSYIIYDRAFMIRDFLNHTDHKNRTFFFCEADFIFHNFIDLNSFSGEVTAQYYEYMNPLKNEFCNQVYNFYKTIINPSFIDIDLYYKPLGWPYLISEEVLRKIIDRWIELTYVFRTTPHNPLYKNWICDMFGMVFALAEQRIECKEFDIMGMPPFNNKDYPISHYCYEIRNIKGEEIFNKKNFKGQTIPLPHLDWVNNLYVEKFIKRMNQLVERNSSSLVFPQ